VHPPGECGIAGLEGERRFGGDPEGGPVLAAIAVGVLDGGLGLADAAQAADGLDLTEGGPAPLGETLPEVGEDLVSPFEEAVPLKDGPEWARRGRPAASRRAA
jgi:hypothetical protein